MKPAGAGPSGAAPSGAGGTGPSGAGTGTTSLWQLLKERRTRDAIYHAKEYWDARAGARSGLARSLWPSNVYNEFWHLRQMDLLARALGTFAGHHVIDIGCGTGRTVRHFAEHGAKEVVGVDFSPATVQTAHEESQRLLHEAVFNRVRFEVGDVTGTLSHLGSGAFDDAIVLGCLSVACRTRPELERALRNISRLVRRSGRVVLLEPIHRSPLLRRILPFGVEEWIACANRAGLHLTGTDRMGFVPVRAVFSVRDWPRAITSAAFWAGEAILDQAPYLAPLSDYKLLVFEKVQVQTALS